MTLEPNKKFEKGFGNKELKMPPKMRNQERRQEEEKRMKRKKRLRENIRENNNEEKQRCSHIFLLLFEIVLLRNVDSIPDSFSSVQQGDTT